MATTTTYYPEYRETSLAIAVDDFPVGTPTGINYCYYIDGNNIYPLPYRPTSINDLNTKCGNYAEYQSSVDSYAFPDDTTYVHYYTKHNFTKPLPLLTASFVLYNDLPTAGNGQVNLVKVLATDGNRQLAIYQKVQKLQSNAAVYLGLFLRWFTSAPDYTLTADLPLSQMDPRKHTAEEIVSTFNNILSNLTLYLTPKINPYSLTDAQRRIQTTDGLGLMAEYNNGYVFSPGDNTGVLTIASEGEVIPTPPTPPEPPGPSDDPYNPGGYSGSGGGPNPDGTGATGTGGLHDDTSDTIAHPSLPATVSTASGLFTAYNPSASQLASFANSLWSTQYTSFDELFKILFGGDAFNAIIGLHLLPVQPSTGSSRSIKLGNWDSSVQAPVITNQYVKVEFGNLMLPEYWGNCIDYSPYTRIQLALPYIGIVDVDTDDVLGSNNNLVYNIDVLSGAICATLQCSKGNLNSVIYQWSGSCAVELPVTGANYNSMLSTSLGAALGSGTIASKAMSAVIASGGGSPITAGVVAAGAVAGAASTIYGSSKGKIQRSGAFGSNAGALGIMTPYFIITRPVQSVPTSWQADKGYPANISAQLGTVTGYTEVSEINLECSGTEAEKKEIIDFLKKGVLF